MTEITVKTLTGAALQPWVADIARLRIAVFRAFPYLYDGTLAYEEKYLQTYLNTADSIAVLALAGDQAVGVSTGLPLRDETAEFKQPFIDQGYRADNIFYCAESVLLPEYRGRGIYRRFFQAREVHARSLGGFDYFTFCAVQRAEDHPLKPQGYISLAKVWNHFGYRQHPELKTHFRWKDIGDDAESDKPMVFWLKAAR